MNGGEGITLSATAIARSNPSAWLPLLDSYQYTKTVHPSVSANIRARRYGNHLRATLSGFSRSSSSGFRLIVASFNSGFAFHTS